MSELRSVNETAAILRVSRRTVYYWIASGYLTVEPTTAICGNHGGRQPARRIRADSKAFGVKPEHRQKTDARTAWRIAAAERKAVV